jgi:hypothetical protein
MKLREIKSVFTNGLRLPRFLSKQKPEQKLTPKPLIVNISPERKVLRHAGRLMRLYSALSKGQETPEIQAEIRKLRLFVEAEGFLVSNEAEAVALYKLLEGA